MLLSVKNLSTEFPVKKGIVRAVEDVSFDVDQGEILAIVGESGSGKSVTSLSIMGLLAEPGHVAGGSLEFEGKDLATLSEKQYRELRGNDMAMIFQEPMTSLNPLLTIGYQLTEGLRQHLGMSKAEAHATAVSYLEKVGIANAEERMKQYPFQLSGGLRQRIMIAMMMSLQPRLLIADEPTTALDVTIQKQVLLLLNRLKQDMKTGILFITHDLGVVAQIADRVIVLYSGSKVEEGATRQIFENPLHPYTNGLIAAVPNVDSDEFEIRPIPGTFPSITEEIGGCRFYPRCPYATERCRQEVPQALEYEPGHFVACHKVEEENK